MNVSYQQIKSPLLLHMELTSACNHKCIHCYNYWREDDSSAEVMSKNHLHKILADATDAQVENIVFTGGEPLIAPDLLFEAIDTAHANGIQSTINSNVTLLTNDIAKEIKKRNVSILTSIPSHDEDTFDFIVNKKGAYQKAVRGVQVAIKHGIHLTANMVLMKQNAKDVLSTGRFLQGLGVVGFAASKVHPAPNSSHYELFKINAEELSHALDDLMLLKKEGMKVDTLTCYPMCAFNDIARYEDLFERRSCSAGITTAAIGVNGEMRACALSSKSYGNALSENITEIWSKMSDWRDGSYLPEDCQKCSWEEKCGGGCRVSAEASSGSLGGMDEIANPDNIDAINYVPPEVELPDLDDDALLSVNPHIELREEDCGVFVKVGGNTQLVTKNTINLLQDLVDEPMSINALIDKHKVSNPADFKIFIRSLHKENFINLPDSEDTTHNLRKEKACQEKLLSQVTSKTMNSGLSL